MSTSPLTSGPVPAPIPSPGSTYQSPDAASAAVERMAAIQSAEAEYQSAAKSNGVMWLLWWFTGAVGGHRYYLGDTGMGIAMTLTLGGLGFWALFDAFAIGGRLREKNQEIRREVFNRRGLPA